MMMKTEMQRKHTLTHTESGCIGNTERAMFVRLVALETQKLVMFFCTILA